MNYQIDQNLSQSGDQLPRTWEHTLCVLSFEATAKLDCSTLPFQPSEALMHNVRVCHVDTMPDCISGVIAYPPRDAKTARGVLLFYLWEDNLLVVDDSHLSDECIASLQSGHGRAPLSAGLILCELLLSLLRTDPALLDNLETQAEKLEDVALDGLIEKFDRKMLKFRKTLSGYSHFYSGMSNIAALLMPNLDERFTKRELRLLELVAARADHLDDQAQQLHDYAIQIREVYQAELDIRQNRIMKALTVVTTIFLPLTLLAGWYGMNFPNMPLLNWRFGYPVMCALSAATVAFCLYLCKKKKFW